MSILPLLDFLISWLFLLVWLLLRLLSVVSVYCPVAGVYCQVEAVCYRVVVNQTAWGAENMTSNWYMLVCFLVKPPSQLFFSHDLTMQHRGINAVKIVNYDLNKNFDF